MLSGIKRFGVRGLHLLIMEDCASAYGAVLERLKAASNSRPPEFNKIYPRLVAVSKTKPASMVVEVYQLGQRHFGENYVQELEEKANSKEVIDNCQEIQWHFIGHLQRNKVNKIIGIPNLYMIETIDSVKLATAVDAAVKQHALSKKLKVMVQVNTSSEDNKNGCAEEVAAGIVSHVINNCSHLEFAGLMTIGYVEHDLSLGPNPDFERLIRCKRVVCEKLSLNPDVIELSMGMSADFEHAISLGSTNVRVGSVIFGVRNYKSSAVK